MQSELGGRLTRTAFILCISLGMTPTWAQEQVLDRVDAFNATDVLEMTFDDPNSTVDFFNLGIVGTAIRDCKLTALDGIFCQDGNVIKHWPDTTVPGTSINEFSCTDPALQLVTNKPDTCAAMTVGLSGAIYLAGRKSNSYSLIRVVAKPDLGNCPQGGYTTFADGNYCARELYTGRPQQIDLDPIDGDVAAAFKPCPTCAAGSGILSVEDKKNVVFYRDPKPTTTTAPILIANGQAWGLAGNEQLISAAVLQIPNGGVTDSYVVVATTNSRMLAKKTNGAGSAFQVFNIPAQREPSSIQCNFDTQTHNVRASSNSGRVYVTDKNFCQVIALAPNGPPFTALVHDVTLATADTFETNPPTGPTLAPGININLEDCSVSCTYLQDEEGDLAASFVAVQLNTGSESNATVFQITGIPDCRQAHNPPDYSNPDFPLELQAVCDAHPEAIVDPDNVGHPAAQLLNVTALLPDEILEMVGGSIPAEGLPDLLISRQYIATIDTGFLFEAFLYITQPGVQFQGNFFADYDLPNLGGPESLACLPDPGALLDWGVITNVSELYLSTDIDDDNVPEFVDTLTNSGCINPTRTLQKGISLVPYLLAINPDTYGPTILSTDKEVTEGNDAVFARLVQSLYDDLDFVRRELACKAVDDPSALPPLSASVCNTLASKWANGKIKLDKCIDAAFAPKESFANENCQSFLSQLTNYRNTIPTTTPTHDIANRTGEQRMRVDVIFHVFNTRLLASMDIATEGFCREQDVDLDPLTCPDPWE
jgi:hypothetical protein